MSDEPKHWEIAQKRYFGLTTRDQYSEAIEKGDALLAEGEALIRTLIPNVSPAWQLSNGQALIACAQAHYAKAAASPWSHWENGS